MVGPLSTRGVDRIGKRFSFPSASAIGSEVGSNVSDPATDVWTGSGTLAAVNQEVTLECAGSASAAIHIEGTFAGTIEVTGAAIQSANDIGGRLIFKSGVGSLGTNVAVLDGTFDDEWRVVTGGHQVTVRCTDYTSGSLTVRIGATANPSIVFINGPVHDAEEEAVRAGRGFLASTSLQDVTNGNVLDVKLDNPAGSGVNCFLLRRLFANLDNDTLEYQAYGGPDDLDTPVAANAANRKVGGPVSSVLMTYQIRSAATAMGGFAASAEGIPPDSNVRRELLAILPPGTSAGFRYNGDGNLVNAARIGITLEWYEEDIA